MSLEIRKIIELTLIDKSTHTFVSSFKPPNRKGTLCSALVKGFTGK